MTPQQLKAKSSNKLLFKISAVLISLAITLVSIELLLRLIGFPYKILWVPSENAIARFDEALGWSYIPNLSKDVKFSETTAPVSFDSHGIRVANPNTRLSPTLPSVLFIGCSFTLGDGIPYEETFVSQFEELAGNRYQAVNLGIQGQGTDVAYLALQKFAPQFNTKAVIYTFMEDHITKNGVGDRRLLYPNALFPGTKPLFALDGNDRLYQKKYPVLYKNYINSYLYDLMRMTLGRKLGTFPPFPVDLTKELIRSMKSYCDQHNIRFIVVNWHWAPGEQDYLKDLKMEKIDTLQNAPFGWSNMRIADNVHPNAQANAHVARLIQQALKP